MKVLGWLRSFGAFWYDFVIGDDWRVAVGVVLGLAATYWLTHSTSGSFWWLLPALVGVLLPVSIHRVTGRGR
jgi:hypothetical protein